MSILLPTKILGFEPPIINFNVINTINDRLTQINQPLETQSADVYSIHQFM